MSGFRVIESGLRGFPPVANSKRKIPVWIGLKQRLGAPRKQLKLYFKNSINFSLTYN